MYRSFGILLDVWMGIVRSPETFGVRLELAAGLGGAGRVDFFINFLYVPSKYIFTARSILFPQLLLIAERTSSETLSPMKASKVSWSKDGDGSCWDVGSSVEDDLGDALFGFSSIVSNRSVFGTVSSSFSKNRFDGGSGELS